METLFDAIKSLKLWQIAVLAAVLFGGIGGAYGGYALIGDSDGTSLAENQQLIPVQRDNLVNQVSVSGSLVYPNRETLSFGSQGTAEEVLVEEGQRVVEGQPLARLDSATVASLETAVARARVDLQEAEEALDEANNPHTDLDLAKAEAAVASARLSVEDTQEALDRLLEPTSQAVAQAESAVVTARLALEAAEDELALLSEPSALGIARAEAAVTSAEIAVQNAQEALDLAIDGPGQEDIADARLQIGFAETSLVNSQRDLTLARTEWDEKLAAAQNAHDDAVEVYNEAVDAYGDTFQGWLGIELSEEEKRLDPVTLLDTWNADLDSLFNPGNAPNPYYGIPSDDPDTRWDEATIFTWLFFYPGTLLGTCENIALTGQVQCAQREMDDAWDAIQMPEDDTGTVEIQRDKAVANAEKAVAQAEEGLAAAQVSLSDLTESADPLEIENREKQLAIAIAVLQEAKEDLAGLVGGSDPQDVEAKQAQVTLAGANLDKAAEDLADITDGPDAVEVDVKRKQLAVAQADLVETEDDLAELMGSVDPFEVELREAEAASAQADLEAAVQRLADATLSAPWDGIVSLVSVEAGQSIGANTPVLEIVDPTVIEVDGIVDEIDVLFIQIGAQAQVTMDALAGQVLRGTVSGIGAEARTQQGVVSYPISITVEAPQGVELPEGLSATANVVIREETDVLMVPLQSLYGTFQQPVVRVMSGGGIEERPVVLGNNDDFWVVVLDGLKEGDQVVIEAEEASTGGFGGFDGFGTIRQFTGSGPGGGRGRPQ